MNHKYSEPQKVYAFTYLVLLGLLATTFFIARANFGALNTILGLIVAGAKALLVSLYFMHLKTSKATQRIAVGAALLWLGVLVSLTLADYSSRSWLMLPGQWP